MSGQLNFRRGKRLFQRCLRAAKKGKNYQCVLSVGESILELDKRATFLKKIATPIFQKDMAEACIKLGAVNSAIEYLLAAKAGFEERRNGSDDWQKDIELINKKLAKLMPCA
ncbi:hypothetical protein BI364_15730 [Acidihalobacter yilgarnensis]|uniref:Four helix bundle protein n=1 Tax=Acidihalobacter yilgarnensis TaxID=2819280 RepID=A0A1D8IRR7_9GAMM|nr:hypothetical protein BI364_15730 [Acidihalobacter yilgarnensis]